MVYLAEYIQMKEYKVIGETPDGNPFQLPVEATDESTALEKAREQLPDEYDVQTTQ